MVWSTSSPYGKKEPEKDEPEQKTTQFLTKNKQGNTGSQNSESTQKRVLGLL